MIEAGLWGFAAASSLIIGAILAFAFDLSRATRGLILAFGAGTLLGAVAYELIEDSLEESERGIEVGIGFALGALTFYVGSVLIDRMSGGDGGAGGDGTPTGPAVTPEPHDPAAGGPRAPRDSRSSSGPCLTGSPSRSCSACR